MLIFSSGVSFAPSTYIPVHLPREVIRNLVDHWRATGLESVRYTAVFRAVAYSWLDFVFDSHHEGVRCWYCIYIPRPGARTDCNHPAGRSQDELPFKINTCISGGGGKGGCLAFSSALIGLGRIQSPAAENQKKYFFVCFSLSKRK